MVQEHTEWKFTIHKSQTIYNKQITNNKQYTIYNIQITKQHKLKTKPLDTGCHRKQREHLYFVHSSPKDINLHLHLNPLPSRKRNSSSIEACVYLTSYLIHRTSHFTVTPILRFPFRSSLFSPRLTLPTAYFLPYRDLEVP
jgi:hypothetical protein